MTSQDMINAKPTNQQAISAMILRDIRKDGTAPSKDELKSAFDGALGIGAYDNLVSGLYDDLRAKNNA